MKTVALGLLTLLALASPASAQSLTKQPPNATVICDPVNATFCASVNSSGALNVGGATGGGGTFTWPGTAVVTNYGTAPVGTVPAVNAFVTNPSTFAWPGTAAPTNYGAAPTGTVPAVNAFVTNSTPFIWPGTAALTNYGTAPAGTVPAVNAFVTNQPAAFTWPGSAAVTAYGTAPSGTVPAVNAFVTNPTSGAITAAAGSYATGAFAVGAGVDGWNVTLGTTAQAPCAAYNTAGCSQMQLARLVAQLLATTSTGYHHYSLTTAGGDAAVIKTAPGVIYNLMISQTTTTPMELKLYNLAAAPTCSSGANILMVIPIPSQATSPGFSIPFATGLNFTTGIAFCLVAFGNPASDTDAGAAALGVVINVGYN